MSGELWRYREASAFLGITENSLRRKVMRREVPFYRPFKRKGTRVLFDPEQLRAFVLAGAVEPDRPPRVIRHPKPSKPRKR
jgi:hypothetical protein